MSCAGDAHHVPLRRPHLSNRYKDYGWPATIVFAADGSEIVKRQGSSNLNDSCACSRRSKPTRHPRQRAAGSVDREATTASRGALDEKTLANPRVALSEITEPGILLADDEVHADHLHLTVMRDKGDPVAKVLFSTTLHLPPWNKWVEWWDRSEVALPNPDVRHPPTPRAVRLHRQPLLAGDMAAAQIVPFLRESIAVTKTLPTINTTATHD